VQGVEVGLVVDLELEALALAYAGDARDTEARQGREDGGALRVEDLRLEHHVDDHPRHDVSVNRAGLGADPRSAARLCAAAGRTGQEQSVGLQVVARST